MAKKVVSIINLASVASIENLVGAPVDPLRFRANLYVEGWPAWHEFGLLGHALSLGGQARLRVVKRIVRCAATNVEPGTGTRDMTIPQAGDALIDMVVRTASGRLTAAEALGHREFVMTKLYRSA